MNATQHTDTAPPWAVSEWLNTDQPLSLESLRGRVIVLHAFQMLCPGCVSHGLPQAQRVYEAFDAKDVAVVGLHTVFEHHAAMTRVSLEAFVYEYRLRFPIGIDAPGVPDGVPQTMQAYGLRGTPSLILIDRASRIRLHEFGHVPDLALGAAIAQLIGQRGGIADETADKEAAASHTDASGCDDQGCAIP